MVRREAAMLSREAMLCLQGFEHRTPAPVHRIEAHTKTHADTHGLRVRVDVNDKAHAWRIIRLEQSGHVGLANRDAGQERAVDDREREEGASAYKIFPLEPFATAGGAGGGPGTQTPATRQTRRAGPARPWEPGPQRAGKKPQPKGGGGGRENRRARD